MKISVVVLAVLLVVAMTCGTLVGQIPATRPTNPKITPLGPHAQQPAGGQHPAPTGTIYGFVYWDSKVTSHLSPSICTALSITVVTSSPYSPIGVVGSQSHFTSMPTANPPLTSVNTTSYDGCAYSYNNAPLGQNLYVKVNLTQTVGTLTPAVVAQDPAVGPIQFSNAPCTQLPPLTKATVGELIGKWGSCQNVAYDVNFPLVQTPQLKPLSASGGLGGNQGGSPGALVQVNPGPQNAPGALVQTNPGPTQTPGALVQVNPGPQNAPVLVSPGPQQRGMLNQGGSAGTLLNNQSSASSPTRGMLVPAVKPSSALAPVSSQPGTQPGTPGPLVPARPGENGTVQPNGQPLPPRTATPAASPGGSSQSAGVGILAPAPITSAVSAGGQGQSTGGVSPRIPTSDLSALNGARRANVLKGFVDLHTHPLSNLAFGGKLVYGGIDIGSLLPADPTCNHNVRATSMQQALGHDNSTHGGWGTDNGCGDSIRSQVIHALQQANKAADPPDDAYGAPDFKDWPIWTDITHQKMWVDWIYRSYQGGLRVMVALAVNNKTMGDATAGPGDYPTDDKSSADLQISETKAFVQRHANFMEVAYSSADVDRIIKSNKLAVVLGVEIDNIGNLNLVQNLGAPTVTTEIDRLYNEGVRYIFPIHVIDNPFGGTAVYEGAFNMSNYHITGNFWTLECANPVDGITYRYQPDGFDLAVALVKATKLGIDVFRNPPDPPNCAPGDGDENSEGLTRLGEFAIKEMMRHGMLIDIDHMSQKAANRALDIAETIPGGYPLFSGHNTPRGRAGGESENQRTPAQYARIAKLGGMAGVGTAGRDAYEWLHLYQQVVMSMHQQSEALGTDFNGLVKGMPPRRGSHITYSASFPTSSLGSKRWNYSRDGVAHYGMLPEFLMDAKTGPGGAQLIDNNLMYGAETFFEAWQKCESLKSKVN